MIYLYIIVAVLVFAVIYLAFEVHTYKRLIVNTTIDLKSSIQKPLDSQVDFNDLAVKKIQEIEDDLRKANSKIEDFIEIHSEKTTMGNETQTERDEYESDKQLSLTLTKDINNLKNDLASLKIKIEEYSSNTNYEVEPQKISLSEFSDSVNNKFEEYGRRLDTIASSVQDVEHKLSVVNESIEAEFNDILISIHDLQEESNHRFEITNTDVLNNRSQLEKLANSIQTVENAIPTLKVAYEVELNKIHTIIHNYVDDYNKLKRKVENYTDIKADSLNLNLSGLFVKPKLSLNNQENTAPTEHVEEVVAVEDTSITQEQAKACLDEDQLHAYEAMEYSSSNLFITGKAGTGKSYLIEMFCRSTCKKVLKLAPTGVAALNIKGVTIHKAFEYENLEVLPYNLINKDNVFFRPNKLRVLKEAETLIIDEISMVNAEIFDRIDQLLRIACDSDELFAGKHIILFGDVFQLPPVLTSNRYYDYKKRYGSVYFFNSPPFKLGGFRFIELTVNHRQEEDKAYFDMLNRLRENGSFDNSDLETLNSRYVSDRSQLRRMITLYPRKENVNIINKKELDAIDAPVFTYHAQVVINEKNDQTTNFENRFPISETLELKVGALIMMVQNDIFNRWVNGTLGIVSSLGADEVFVTIDGVEYEVKRATFDEREPRYVNGKIKYFPVFSVSQFPLVIAYAVTIHKAQGMTYKQIACDLSECFAPGQSYVALSRCESLEGLHLLNKLSPETVGVDKEVLDFYHQSFPTHE